MPRRSDAMRILMLVATAVTLSTIAAAREWRVEKDGSGDFTVIQDAVDVAASGDTIRIGVGRFDDQQWVSCPGWQEFVRVLVHQYELTIIGSGPETIIGQVQPWEEEQRNHKGIVAGDYFDNHVIRVENIRFDNMRSAIYTSYESTGEDTVVIRGCAFFGNNCSLSLIGDGGEVSIQDCTFDQAAVDGKHIVAWRQSLLEIDRCIFRLWDQHLYNQQHLAMESVQLARVTDCEFLEGAIGATSSNGTMSVFERCVFDGQSLVGVVPSILAVVTLDRCAFRNQIWVSDSYTSDNEVLFTSCTIENVTDCAFHIWYAGSFTVQDCDVAGGNRGVVWCKERSSCAEIQTLDMTGNYWGTADPDSIAALIRDNNDSDEACFIIDYEPFASESTPVESKSLSDLKSLFR